MLLAKLHTVLTSVLVLYCEYVILSYTCSGDDVSQARNLRDFIRFQFLRYDGNSKFIFEYSKILCFYISRQEAHLLSHLKRTEGGIFRGKREREVFLGVHTFYPI